MKERTILIGGVRYYESRPKNCRGCMYYHPEFRYRKCLKSVCPYGKCEKEVFRNRPLQGLNRIPLPKPVV